MESELMNNDHDDINNNDDDSIESSYTTAK